MNPVVHFEMPAEDTKRMVTFYAAAFGWTARELGKEMNNYVLVDTSERAPDRFPKERGRINGGLFPKTDAPQSLQHPSLVIAVESITAGIERVTSAGGTIIGHPVMIPGNGMYVQFIDTEGNQLSMIEPTPM